MTLRKPLEGIIVPLVTPLRGPDELDAGGLERLIEHTVAGGVSGLFVLGTTGEGPGLSRGRREELIECTCKQVDGRVPVLAGITDTSFPESIALSRFSANCGADAVVYAGPCYFPVSQPELASHVERLAAELPLPLFLYNMPSHTGVTFERETVLRLAQSPNIAGLKDSSGNLVYFKKCCLALAGERPGFTLLMGPEELLGEAVLFGGHGGVTGGANLFPRLYVDLYRAALNRNIQDVIRLQKAVLRLTNAVYEAGAGPSSYLCGLKCALSIAGICSDYMAEPYTRFGCSERERIAEALRMLEVG